MDYKYSTSDICKLCGISRKQLRYYEEKGLIKGVKRNDVNNYRYYSDYAFLELMSIREFRRMEFSIEEIRDMLVQPGVSAIREAIKKKIFIEKDRLNRSLLLYEQYNNRYLRLTNTISMLQDHVSEGNSPKYEVIEFEAKNVISVSSKGTFIGNKEIEEMAKLTNIIDEYDLITSGPVINIFNGHFDSVACEFSDDPHEINLCMPVVEIRTPCPYYKRIKAVKVLSTFYFGDYLVGLSEAYIDMLHWAKENGYRLSNVSIEEWLIGPLDTFRRENWVVKIMIPLEDQYIILD